MRFDKQVKQEQELCDTEELISENLYESFLNCRILVKRERVIRELIRVDKQELVREFS